MNRQEFANETEKAIFHPITERAIEELLFNLNKDQSSMEYYGIIKLCNTVGQVARAQALGIDPEILRMSDAEAQEAMLQMVNVFAANGGKVIVVAEDV